MRKVCLLCGGGAEDEHTLMCIHANIQFHTTESLQEWKALHGITEIPETRGEPARKDVHGL